MNRVPRCSKANRNQSFALNERLLTCIQDRFQKRLLTKWPSDRKDRASNPFRKMSNLPFRVEIAPPIGSDVALVKVCDWISGIQASLTLRSEI